MTPCPARVVISPREPGRCSFVADWDASLGSILSHADVLDGLCGRDGVYTTVDTHGQEAEVCVGHAAHVRACGTCSGWLASIRSVTPC